MPFYFFLFYVPFFKLDNQLKYHIDSCWSRPRKRTYLLFRDSFISAWRFWGWVRAPLHPRALSVFPGLQLRRWGCCRKHRRDHLQGQSKIALVPQPGKVVAIEAGQGKGRTKAAGTDRGWNPNFCSAPTLPFATFTPKKREQLPSEGEDAREDPGLTQRVAERGGEISARG